MDTLAIVTVFSVVFQIGMLVFGILFSYRLIGKREQSLPSVFFTFALVSWLLADLYWLAYDILRPDTRMPFAANEFGEWAMFLMILAGLNSMYPRRNTRPGTDTLLTGFFMACNVALWIGWSGEWLEDVITGLVMGALVCTLVRELVEAKVYSGRMWAGITCVCGVLILMQSTIFIAPKQIGRILDVCCYLVLFSGIAFFCIGAMRKHSYLLALTGFSWILISMYMSEGIPYLIMFFIDSLFVIVLVRSFRREVMTDDLR
ncbi:MAG: hypothetical protein K6E50_02175 [Lachnospiraceae bacterium]|nr:hypothetical protein [Lachnospiraceae bacterium]